MLHHPMPLLRPSFSLPLAALLAAATSGWAQTPPSSSSQLLQIPQPPQRTAPAPEQRSDVPQEAKGATDNGEKILVRRLALEGVRSLDAGELLRISGFVAGASYSIGELRELADRVTTHYRSLGYFLAQTYLPAQDATEGVVRLQVVEGQYGTVRLQNESRLRDAVAWRILEDLKSATAVTDEDLERRLLLLSDLPGVQARSVLTRGASLGTTDLLVELQPLAPITGSVDADNEGNRYTGKNRVGASLSVNGLAGLGDLATVRWLSAGDGLSYGRASYQLNWGGLSTGVAFATLQYQLGAEFASTEARGTAEVGSLFASYPLLRSRLANLSLQLAYDDKNFSDQFGSVLASRKSVRETGLTLRGEARDSLGARSSQYSLTWTQGTLDLQDAMAQQTDAASARTQGRFDKLVLAWSGQQAIAAGSNLLLSVTGQLASKNLDASEKFTLGGAQGVRAYPAERVRAMLVTLESRTALAQLGAALGGQLQLLAFVDLGHVVVNKQPWDTGRRSATRTLGGAGLGLSYASPQNWTLRAVVAARQPDEAAVTEPDQPTRFWLQASKLF